MSLTKGSVSLTRYKIQEEVLNLSDDYLSQKLIKNAFVDIENFPEELSLGWVEFFNNLAVNFNTSSYRIGDFIAFTLRLDTRKVSTKVLNRYYALREAEYIEKTEKKPNSLVKKELKDVVKYDLLQRCLLSTEIMEVLWLQEKNEIWLAAVGEKKREIFEQLWKQTFALPLQMLVPITIAQEILPDNLQNNLKNVEALSIWGSGLAEERSLF